MNADAAAEIDDDEEDEEAPGLWTSFFTALRLIVGWFCLAIGVLNLIVEVDRNSGSPDRAYFAYHVMMLVGGLLLLGLGWLDRDPGLPGYLAGGAVALVGLIASGIQVSMDVCCMTAFAVRHGWPFTFMAKDTGRWHIDSQHLLADLLFWGFAGLIVLVAVALLRPQRADREPEPETPRHSTHAESRAARLPEREHADD